MREQLQLAVHRLLSECMEVKRVPSPLPGLLPDGAHERWRTDDRIQRAKFVGQHIGLVLAGYDGPLVFDWVSELGVVPTGTCVLNRDPQWLQEQA